MTEILFLIHAAHEHRAHHPAPTDKADYHCSIPLFLFRNPISAFCNQTSPATISPTWVVE
jgi:hypothetical protein